MNNLNICVESMVRYAKGFLLFLRTREAKELNCDLIGKFSACWMDMGMGLPAGWGVGPDGKGEARTREFLIRSTRIVEWGELLDKGDATGDYSELDDAIAEAVCDEMGDEEQQ